MNPNNRLFYIRIPINIKEVLLLQFFRIIGEEIKLRLTIWDGHLNSIMLII